MHWLALAGWQAGCQCLALEPHVVWERQQIMDEQRPAHASAACFIAPSASPRACLWSMAPPRCFGGAAGVVGALSGLLKRAPPVCAHDICMCALDIWHLPVHV